MGAMKRLLEEIAEKQGTWDISDPEVIAEAQNRLERGTGDPQVVAEAQRRLALPYRKVAEWHDGERAGYELELPNGTRLVFEAEMCDCRCKDAYIKADLTEDATPRRQDAKVIAYAG